MSTDLDFVRARLRETKGQWLRIARETGVGHRVIYNVVYEINDPRSSTVNALAAWFRAQDCAAIAQPATPAEPSARAA